jgi:hypothetical protein
MSVDERDALYHVHPRILPVPSVTHPTGSSEARRQGHCKAHYGAHDELERAASSAVRPRIPGDVGVGGRRGTAMIKLRRACEPISVSPWFPVCPPLSRCSLRPTRRNPIQ